MRFCGFCDFCGDPETFADDPEGKDPACLTY
jgi:hypothetical protein